MQCTGLQYSLTVHQISLKRIISYKSSLTDAPICLPQAHSLLSSMVEPEGRQHSRLHPLSVNKILEQKRSMTSEFLYTVIDPLLK